MLRILLIVSLGCLVGCASTDLPPPPPAAQDIRASIGICGAGLDTSTKSYVEAQIIRSGGQLGSGVESQVRAAIVNMLTSKQASQADINRLYESYLSCISAQIADYKAYKTRYEAAACRRACCNQYECDSGCAMVNVEG